MNKRKKVAWHKHLKKSRKLAERAKSAPRTGAGATAAPTASRRAPAPARPAAPRPAPGA